MLKGILSEQNLSLDRLNSFLEIVDAGSIVDAVGRDPSRQSLYSKHKKDLEEVFGEKLFYQKNRKLTPTEFGQELVALVRSFEKSLNDLDAKYQKRKSVVSIGAGDSVFQWMLLPFANALQSSFKDTQFQFQNLRTEEIEEGVRSGAVDIGILRSIPSQGTLSSVKLRSFCFGLFYHPDNFPKPSIREILYEGCLIGLSGAGSYVKHVFALQRQHGIKEGFWIQFDSMPMVENSLIQTKSSAILPLEAKSSLESKGFKMIDGKHFDSFTREYCMLLNTDVLKIRKKTKSVSDQLFAMLS